jgi:hypothetical protein
VSKLYSDIDETLRRFIESQHVFFVATAPSGPTGHVNCSPKGLDSFAVLGRKNVAYIDFVGSGVETIAHVRENGRIVIMFCAFEGPPNIVRLHGHATVVEPAEPEFATLLDRLPHVSALGIRAIVRVDVTRISDSCGYGVPLLKYEGDRNQLPAWAERKGPEGLAEYKRRRNLVSIDGLGALEVAGEAAQPDVAADGTPPRR